MELLILATFKPAVGFAVPPGLKQPWREAGHLFPIRTKIIMGCTGSAVPVLCLYSLV